MHDPASTVHLLAAGRFFERATDGREIELGRVRDWEAPHRILLDFYVATGPDKPTEVEVEFKAEGDGTRVTVRHGPKPDSAQLWAERAPRYELAWQAVLTAMVRYSQAGQSDR